VTHPCASITAAHVCKCHHNFFYFSTFKHITNGHVYKKKNSHKVIITFTTLVFFKLWKVSWVQWTKPLMCSSCWSTCAHSSFIAAFITIIISKMYLHLLLTSFILLHRGRGVAANLFFVIIIIWPWSICMWDGLPTAPQFPFLKREQSLMQL